MRRGLVILEHRDGDEFPSVTRVLRVLAEIDGGTLRKIQSAHDHKGTLMITWAVIPDEHDMTRIEQRWLEENEPYLEYTFPDDHRIEVEVNSTVRTPI